VRGLLIFLGLLLVLGGGAVAGAQFAPMDLAALPALDPVFNLAPGARDFLKTQEALYAGGGAAGLGLLMIIIATATGGGKRKKARASTPAPSPKLAPETVAPPPPGPAPKAQERATKPAPAPQPAAAPPPTPAARPAEAAPKPAAMPVPPATAAAPPQPAPAAAIKPAPAQAPQSAVTPTAAPTAKPQASGQPPAAADPRLLNRKRVQDLVTINDALRNYYAKNGAYPKAEGLAGANERGAAWIPGLSPEFLASLPRDPQHNGVTQYVYASDGANYKLIAQGASLVGSGNVEVLGIKIDPTRNPTAQNAAFGFWTPPFAGA